MPIIPPYMIAILTLIRQIVNSFRKNTNFARESMRPLFAQTIGRSDIRKATSCHKVGGSKNPRNEGNLGKYAIQIRIADHDIQGWCGGRYFLSSFSMYSMPCGRI